MTGTERQWVAFLQACRARHLHAAELREHGAAVLDRRSWQDMTRDEVGELIRVINECTRKGAQALTAVSRYYAQRMGDGNN